ncbi:MAG: AsmA-like C-terminal domain-containing protein [Candidatus Scalindua sp.]|nr:AsmA-like C-terminal domain-containing protein [Candidatus Scalindua sp.]
MCLKGKKVKVSLHIGEAETKVSFTELKLEYPLLDMRGELVVDHETRKISLELTGGDIDIHSVREEALAFAGDNEAVKNIFQIVKGGKLSDVVIASQGKSLGDIGKMENLVIKGNVREGNIFIPGPELDLEDVTGDFVVEKSTLEGMNIGARLEDSYGQEGRISIGLKGEDAPLHVETEIKAVAGQIPPLLKRLVENENLLREINRVTNVKGTVAGKLSLGGRLNAIKADVDIHKIDVSAHYKDTPFPLHIKNGSFHYDRGNINMVNLGGTFGSSSFSELSARMSLGKDAHIEVQSGKILAFLREIYPWISSFEKMGKSLKDVKSVSGILQVLSLNLKGQLAMPESWVIGATGEVKDLLVDTTLYPEPVEVNEGFFKVVDKEFFLTHSKVKAGNSSLGISGSISYIMTELVNTDIAFHGEIGQESLQWIEKRVNLPPEYSIRPPLSIQKAHIAWKKDSGMSFVSNLTLQNGPEVSVDMILNPEALEIKNVHILDAESNASFRFGLGDKAINFSFTGNLSQTTTDKIFLHAPLAKEWIKGDFQAHILLDQPEHSTFQGVLEGKNLSVSRYLKVPFNISDISLHADTKSVRVDSHILTLSNNHLSVNGEVKASEDGFLFDSDMSADGLEWDTIRKTLAIEDKTEDKRVVNKDEEKDVDESADKGEEKRFWDIPVKGTLRLAAESFTFDQYTWKPLRAHISFKDVGIRVDVTDADLCGISCTGLIKVNPQDILLDFQLLSRNQDVDSTFKCFGNTKELMTGRFDMKTQVVSQGTAETLGKELGGNFEFTAKDGRIYRFGLIAKLFAFLNVTEIFRGKLPDVVKQGFSYKSITANGKIEKGILNLENLFIDGSSMGITSRGKVDLIGEKIDLKVLVSPFKTVDFVVEKIPVVGKLLGGTLVSIPVGIKGDIENPNISYLSPSAVGKKLLDITVNTLKAPVEIIKPVIPGGNGKESSSIK